MILAAGLTPAWQHTLQFDSVQPGEVNRARASQWCASGKVLNVGIALQRLAAIEQPVTEVVLLSCGGGWSLPAMQQDLSREGLTQQWIETEAPTRVCTTVLDLQRHETTELVENAYPVTPAELARFQEAFATAAEQAEVVVLSGSLPAGVPVSYYYDLVRRAGGRVVLDARGPELMQALEWRPFLVKPNREELAQTLGRSLSTDDELLAGMRELVQHGARWVLVTQGADAVWLVSAAEAYRWTPPTVPVVNPIGCGDCLTAGVAAALDRGWGMVEAVRLGLATATDNVGQLLPARIDAGRIRALYPTMPVPVSV